MKNIIKNIALTIGALALIVSCSEDDLTGRSTVEATSPSLSVELGFANSQTLVESETSFPFTVTISEAQVADIRINISQIGGTATDGVDFSIPHTVTIPRGATSVSDVIDIHADDEAEETETAIIKIALGNEANVVAINSQTVTFNIMNVTDGDLAIGMSWAASGLVTDNYGNEIDPTDLADLRLLITDVPYTTILGGADGGSFETTSLDASDPDGEYYIVADFYAADDIASTLDLNLTFDQVGVINNLSYDFPAALDTANSCSSVYYILAQITKSGENYTIAPVGENSPVTAAPFIGTATVVTDDWADYAPGETVEIEAGATENEFWIRSYANPYIANPDTSYMIVTIDPLTGNATVMSNEDFQYGCSQGDVVGSGTVNACAGSISLVLDFLLGNCGDYPGNVFELQL